MLLPYLSLCLFLPTTVYSFHNNSSVSKTVVREAKVTETNLTATPEFESFDDNITFSENSTLLIKNRPFNNIGVRSLSRKHKKKYIISEFKASWLRAMQYCRSQDMQLLELKSHSDQKILERVLKKNNFNSPVWTSGSDNGGDSSFYWISSGSKVSYKKWRRGQPDGKSRGDKLGSDHCLQVSSEDGYEWSDFTCSTKQYFICEED